jgi:hypothetical protein
VNGHGINDLTYSQSCSQRLPRDSPGETYINLSSLSTSTRPDAGEVPSGIESLYDTVLALLQSQVPQAAADSKRGPSPMSATQTNSIDLVLCNLERVLPDLEAFYEDLHSHPELSMQETRTAGLAADRLRAADYEVTTGVGKTGVVGVLRNGDGPTVMLRADMDALPVEEATGLSYASKTRAKNREDETVPVSHMCGHDMHVTWLAGVTKLLADALGVARHPDGGVPAWGRDRRRRTSHDR